MKPLYYFLSLLKSRSKPQKTEEGNKMKMKNMYGIGAIIAMFVLCMAIVTPTAMAVTDGTITLDGLTADNKINANSGVFTLNASGTDINKMVLKGGDDLNSLVELKSWEYNGTNTSVEEEYTWIFPSQGAKVVQLCILDGTTWDNQTYQAFTVSTYIIPMANDDETTWNLMAFACAILIVFAIVWFFLMRNDKTNQMERKEIRKDVIIAVVIAVVVVLAVFLYLGGGWQAVYDALTGWF